MRLLLLTGLAAASLGVGNATAQPRGSFGGGFRGPGPGMRPGAPRGDFRIIQAYPLPRTPGFAPGFPPGYGFTGGIGVPGGFGYGYGGVGYGGFISGGYAPYYVVPPAVISGGGGGVAPPVVSEPSTALAVSGQLPAILVLQFPAAAKVWVDGTEVAGEPDTEWTLTSKVLRPGETATFRVRGRWEAGGKTYEAVREVPLGPGARSRLIVVSGTEVRE